MHLRTLIQGFWSDAVRKRSTCTYIVSRFIVYFRVILGRDNTIYRLKVENVWETAVAVELKKIT